MPIDSITNDSTKPNGVIGCVILAAGGSRRLGQPKQLLCLEGRTLIERVAQTVLQVSALWPVVVVVGAAAEPIRAALVHYPVLVVDNPAWSEGVASSLRTGLETVQRFTRQVDAVLFVLCDQPALDPAMLGQLLARRASGPGSVVMARYGGHPGAPTLIGARHLPALAHLVGDQGAKQLINTLPPHEVELVDLPALAWDIDTPADWAQVQPGAP